MSLYLCEICYTFRRARGCASSLMSSSDFLWSYRCALTGTWRFQPSGCPRLYATGTVATPHGQSIVLSWLTDSNGCAISLGTACQCDLNKNLFTWEVLSDESPLLRAVLLDELDEKDVFLLGPRLLLPWVNEWVTFDRIVVIGIDLVPARDTVQLSASGQVSGYLLPVDVLGALQHHVFELIVLAACPIRRGLLHGAWPLVHEVVLEVRTRSGSLLPHRVFSCNLNLNYSQCPPKLSPPSPNLSLFVLASPMSLGAV